MRNEQPAPQCLYTWGMHPDDFTGPTWLRKAKYVGFISLACFTVFCVILLIFK